MGKIASAEVRDGISIVGGRLQGLVDQGVEVRWAVVGFGDESLDDGRVLLPLSPIELDPAGFRELRSSYTTSDPNTDYRSGLLGAREQLRGSTAECRLMLWFTDGQFDVGPDGEDSGDAPAVIDGVCGDEAGLAQWFRDSNVRSYVILSNDWGIEEWQQRLKARGVLEASLSAMQAITGSSEIVDDRKKGGREQEISGVLEKVVYEVNGACRSFTQNRSEVGGIRLNAGDLEDIFDVLMSELLGDTFVGDCPATLLGVPTKEGQYVVESLPLPDGLVLDQIQIYNLNGAESSLSVFAVPEDGSERRELVLRKTSIDASQIQQLTAGWRIEVEGPEGMEICISHPRPGQFEKADLPVKLVDGPDRPEASQDVLQFEVDLSALPLIKGAQDVGRGADGLLTGVGVTENQKEWEASWSGGTTATLTFKPTSEGRVEFVDLWIEIDTGVEASAARIPLRGRLDPTITVTAPAGSPYFDCGDQEAESGRADLREPGLSSGEVPPEPFTSSIECVIYPPEDDTALVEFSFSETDNSSFQDLGFVFATSRGDFEADDVEADEKAGFELLPGEDPVNFHLEIREPLDNKTWRTNGTFVITVTWNRAGSVPYQSDVTLEVPVDLIARSDTGVALLLTALVALLAMLVSLGLFRFMNSLVKIPVPDDFFSSSADITISNATSGSPRFEWVDLSQLDDSTSVPRAQRPGSDLVADEFTLTRRLPPFFIPFKNITTRTAGMKVIHSSPAAGNGDAPGSFSQLILVGTDNLPNAEDSLAARVVIFHPRRSAPTARDLQTELDRMIAPFAGRVKDMSSLEAASTPVSAIDSEDTVVAVPVPEPVGGVAPPPKRPVGGVAPPPKRPVGGVAPPPKRPVGGVAPPPKRPVGGVAPPPKRPVGGVAPPPKRPVGGVAPPPKPGDGSGPSMRPRGPSK